MSFHRGWMLESRMRANRTWEEMGAALRISARRYTFSCSAHGASRAGSMSWLCKDAGERRRSTKSSRAESQLNAPRQMEPERSQGRKVSADARAKGRSRAGAGWGRELDKRE